MYVFVVIYSFILVLFKLYPPGRGLKGQILSFSISVAQLFSVCKGKMAQHSCKTE